MAIRMDTRELLHLVKNHFGSRGTSYFFDSGEFSVQCILYETFALKFTMDEHGNFGGMVLLSGGRAATVFFGHQLSLNSDEASIHESLEIVDRWCRLHLTADFLRAWEDSLST